MMGTIILIVLLVAVVGGVALLVRQKAAARQRELENAQAEARRWVERLGGQVINLVGSNEASQQALADASERYTAAGSQMEQAKSTEQCALVTATAMEGLYYVRAARTAMGMDPGPELPDLNGQSRAGSVGEDRQIELEGRQLAASPNPGEQTPHYYPGGEVAGRPVPQGWYSEPWWKPALVAGAWGAGSALLFTALFSGMMGVPDVVVVEAAADESGDDSGDSGGGEDSGDYGDSGDYDMSDMGDMGGGLDFE
nr:hypothetical protein [Actinoalloteichus spitiensis]